jgi:tRNA nucleotidyltransferase (CCA-adding enzyme)
MDFDSLGAQLAVTKLYPAARMVLGTPVFGNVRTFLTLYRSSLPIVQMKYVDRSRLTRIHVVDCQNAERLDAGCRELLLSDKKRVEYLVFDHHGIDPNGLAELAAPGSIIEPVGAATTLLVERIKKQRIKLTPFEATVMALGIYEDTGCLTYVGTTERDCLAVAHLLKCGADLHHVNEYIHPKLGDEHAQLLQEMVKSCRSLTLEGVRIVVATARIEDFLPELAGLTRKLMEIESAGAAFTAVYMRDRVHVVGRSDTASVDVRSVVRLFGGDGHHGAGSAVVKTENLEEVSTRIISCLESSVSPEKTAAEIMTSPVRTVPPTVSMDEASRIMIRYGQDGLVVTDEGKVVGVVSRRDIDQATHHRLGHAPVNGFMSRPVLSIQPRTPLSKIQETMVKEDIGRLPVLDEDEQLVGLVSRSDVLRILYGPKAGGKAAGLSQDEVDWAPSSAHKRAITSADLGNKLKTTGASTLWVCELIGETAARLGMTGYLVGGCVRDLLLEKENFDLDFVIEGSAIELAEELAGAYPGRLKVVARHERFQTATLDFFCEEKREVDLSTARTEFYEYPAALPTVEPSKLEQDLLRRDFTINALAVCLNPGRFGQLVDYFGGMNDIKDRVIRILHPFSFIEDPTRIMRAARFAARLGFQLESKSKEQARRAIAMGIFDDLGGTRIRTELKLILASAHRVSALDLLGDLGGRLRYLDAELEYGLPVRSLLRRAERLLEHYPVEDSWLVHLGLLISGLPKQRLENALDRLQLQVDQKQKILSGLCLPDRIGTPDLEPKRSQIYRLFHGQPRESLAIAACLARPGSLTRRMIKLYLEQLGEITIELTGADLLKLGFSQGPELGRVLDALLEARIDGKIKSRDDELAYVRDNSQMVR